MYVHPGDFTTIYLKAFYWVLCSYDTSLIYCTTPSILNIVLYINLASEY